MKLISLFIVILFVSFNVNAQEEEDDIESGSSKRRKGFSVSFVKLLPNQIAGATEIVTLGNISLYMPISRQDLIFGYTTGSGSGVEWSDFSISTTSNVKIADLDSFVYIGADLVNYTTSVANNRTEFGGHVGGGVEFYLNETVTFRSEMKFNVNPGTSLLVMFGFMFPF